MKKSRILAFVFAIGVIVLAGGVFALAVAPIAPPAKTVATPIADDQIPH